MVTVVQLQRWIHRLAEVYREQQAYLTELDAAIGDADHGINMARGFTAVQQQLQDWPATSISALLKEVSVGLIRSVGGAAGPLYGTFFLKVSLASVSKSELAAVEWCDALRQGVGGIQTLGKAQRGDKTMLDCWLPALEAMQREQASVVSMLTVGLEAAETGLHATIAMQARKGRASYLGARSIGHQDPGATSSYLMLQAARETLS